MKNRSALHLNQKLKIPLNQVPKEEFEQKRIEFHKSIEEDFFETYEVIGTRIHELKRGQNLWYCSNKYHVPLWILKRYNKSLETESFSVGKKVMIPIVRKITSAAKNRP